MKVLIIEDDTILQQLLASLLKRRGHEVVAVEKLSHATEELSAWQFDRIICDGTLRGEDGYAYAKMLQDQGKNVVQFTADERRVKPGVRWVKKDPSRTLAQEIDTLLGSN